MAQNKVKEGFLVDGRVVLKNHLGKFLKGKKMDSPKDKIAVIASIYVAERLEENPLVLEEEDYSALLYAVLSDNYVVNTGNFYINIGNPVGREEFLSISGVKENPDGTKVYEWDFESFANAKLFTQEEIDTIVPEPYRNSMYVIMENLAKEKYNKITL